ncbi:MAG: hypothetical protein IJD17_06055 [Clostridia bacterium]|nr:hypothetical protein [Clostridia bacterium]
MKEVFLQLVNMSLTAGWLILAVMLLRLIFRRAPRWVFCLLWGFVGLRLVLPFSLESVFSLIPSKTPVNEVKNAVGRIVLNTAGTPVPLPSGGAAVNTPPVTAIPDVGVVSPSVTLPAAKETLSLTEIFALVWICGFLALLVYAAASYLLLRRRVKTAVRIEKGVWQSEAVTSPFVLGLIKPRIYLPFALDRFDLPYVLAHERAHISRRDHLIKPLGFTILAVYWFNPLIWIAYILLCRDVELACDERVIKSLDKNERRDYSTALLNCSVSRVRIAACPIAFGEVAVKERIKGVMNYKKPAFWIIILAVITTIVTAVCFLTDPKNENPGDETKEYLNEDKVSVTGLTKDSKDKYFTEFLLKVGERSKNFTGQGLISDEEPDEPYDLGIKRYDYTGDGVLDISVIYRSEDYDYETVGDLAGYDEIHVFDGVTLEEIPGLGNLPQEIQESLELSLEGDIYTVTLDGTDYHINKKWYENMDWHGAKREFEFYDLPSFTDEYSINDPDEYIVFGLECRVSPNYFRDDRFEVYMIYKDGEFVLDRIRVLGFYYKPKCSVHNGFYHTCYVDGLIDEEVMYEWYRMTDGYGYENNGCNCVYNIVDFAEHLGITGQQLRDQYYQSPQYYRTCIDPLPLFELDKEGCDEFFRNEYNEAYEKSEHMTKRGVEESFKHELIRLISGSSDPAESHDYFNETTDNGAKWISIYSWSIPEFIYEFEISLEEIRQIYTEYTENIDVYFEYDFARLFTERDYFEELIETAEYPVFVDEALRK